MQTFLFDSLFAAGVKSQKEDIDQVLQALTAGPCLDCRLGLAWPDNCGLIVRGNPRAKVACLSEAPGDKEMADRRAMVGGSGQMTDKWMKYLGYQSDAEYFIINVVQCQPPKVKKEDTLQQRAPEKDEIDICFPNRALRVLRAMPNLEVVITLGWVGAKALLGGEPKAKTHEGIWYDTDLLPGIPVYCMVHPSFLLREPSAEKTGRAIECLDNFRRLYLNTGKALKIAKENVESRTT